MGLTSSQRKYLRGLAHHLDPVLRVGKGGLTDAFVGNLEEALESHELVKIRFADGKDQRRELAAEICERLKCELAGMVGHVAMLYRPARDPDRRKIRLR
ncbi:MAG: YhbY family RNA-binding protein [Thermoanaerobaculia bacterium]